MNDLNVGAIFDVDAGVLSLRASFHGDGEPAIATRFSDRLESVESRECLVVDVVQLAGNRVTGARFVYDDGRIPTTRDVEWIGGHCRCFRYEARLRAQDVVVREASFEGAENENSMRHWPSGQDPISE